MSLDSDVIVDRRRIRRKLTFWRVVAALGVIAAVVAVAAGERAVLSVVILPGVSSRPEQARVVDEARGARLGVQQVLVPARGVGLDHPPLVVRRGPVRLLGRGRELPAAAGDAARLDASERSGAAAGGGGEHRADARVAPPLRVQEGPVQLHQELRLRAQGGRDGAASRARAHTGERERTGERAGRDARRCRRRHARRSAGEASRACLAPRGLAPPQRLEPNVK